MAELKTRIKHKNGTPDEWSQATNFSPLKGELVVYNDATNPRMKIGDGETNVNDLPFINNTFTYDQIIMPDGKKWNGTAGADVVIEPTITSGTKLATVRVNGVSKDLYYQASAVTLNGSATTSANFYAPINAGTAGQVLKSNGSGAPVWGNGDKIVDGTNIVKPYSTTQSSRTGLMAYNTSTNQYLYLYTENASTGDLKIATNANDDFGNHYATVYTTLNKPTAADVGALPISGGTVTGSVACKGYLSLQRDSYPQIQFHNGSGNPRGLIYMSTNTGTVSSMYFRVYTDDTGSNYVSAYLGTSGDFHANTVYGAVWNDYAEYRSQNETIEPGYITYCDDDGKLKKTVERLQKYEGIVSDTFGFAIGETDDCKTPLAVSGRALVYCDPEEEHFHSGDCVCAGPNGLAYRMTREEIIEFPDRIVGVVSEIPTYETWGTGNVEVNGRIWIKVK